MFSAPCDFVSTAPYSYKFGPSSGTALLTMTVADYSRQALLRQCCCIEVRESSSGKNAFFPTMCLLHLHLGFRVASGFILFGRLTHLRMPYAVSVRQVSGLPPASFRSRLAADTLALGYVLGATPCTRDFHPLERAHAERTKKGALPKERSFLYPPPCWLVGMTGCPLPCFCFYCCIRCNRRSCRARSRRRSRRARRSSPGQ